MLLEIGRGISFLLSVLSIYRVAISAFFVVGSRWEDRLELAGVRLLLAGGVCLVSGLLFALPSSKQEAGQNVLSTLPVRMFLWSAAGMVFLFLASWYFLCGGPCCWSPNHNCD